MAAESAGCQGQAIVTFVAHQAQPVVHCLQVIDYGPFILALLPTPGIVGDAAEAAEGIWIMYSHQSHNLYGLRRGVLHGGI